MRAIAQAGAGILLYEQQEGRGIGLMAKLRAYELQDQGLDTVEANLRFGYKPDCREFELPAEILKLLNVSSVRLITNNPEKVEALESVGIRVVERISAEVEPLDSFERYVQVKQEKMGHIAGPALRQNHLGGGNGLPYVALGVLRGVDQQSCERGGQAFTPNADRQIERLSDDGV